MSRLKMLLFTLLVTAIAPVVSAQIDCPAVVMNALTAIDRKCDNTGRNQVCYGNIVLTATPRDGVDSLVFDKAGDRADVTDLQALQLSSMNLADDSWGVALMELQANLPDTLPGQNVTFLLFGDVQMQNAMTTDIAEATLTATGSVNVRLRPTTSGNNIITSLQSGQSIVATGRLDDSSWVRIRVEDDARGVGWVSADFLQGDMSGLAVVNPEVAVWGPMQSFYFKSGAGDRPCAGAPDSGILIQTPVGSGKVILKANDVQIQLGSTLYLQAQPDHFMTVSVVEGQATLAAGGTSQTVRAGAFSQVPLDASGRAAGTPSAPQPYDRAALRSLPLGIEAFHPVEIAPPITAAQNTSPQQASAPTGLPRSGTWTQSDVVTVNDNCGESEPLGKANKGPITLTFSDDRQSVLYNNGWSGPYTVPRISEAVYQGTFGGITFTFTFTSPTTFDYSHVGIFGDLNNGGCHHVLVGSGVFERS